MNQKKHLNAIAALEASKDAEPGSYWDTRHCDHVDECPRCYSAPLCGAKRTTVSEVRAALQSGLDASPVRNPWALGSTDRKEYLAWIA